MEVEKEAPIGLKRNPKSEELSENEAENERVGFVFLLLAGCRSDQFKNR